MNTPRSTHATAAGFSLIEVILAMGVLAVALPLVFAVMARSGQSTAAAQAETRCAWIIPACLNEIEAAHAGNARFLPTLTRGQPFPAPGEVLALAFAADGRALGLADPEAYHRGLKNLADEPIRYLASIRTQRSPAQPGGPPMLNLRLTLEYPSAAPVAKRQKLDFFTRLP
ncbi:MAG: type II secretion system protein [Verrucomicrobia bacterium]|nr:type II secretion system protein [Verrucomicrobiota bacterium]